MKYDVTYACGHTATVNLYGPTAERKKRLEWLQTHAVCPDCYKAAMDAENAEGCEEVTMTYAEYKNGYASCKTKHDSYNADTKTIVVYVPHSEVVEDAPAAEETHAEETPESAESAEVIEIVDNAVAAVADVKHFPNCVSDNDNPDVYYHPAYCRVIAAGYTWRIGFYFYEDGRIVLRDIIWNPAECGDTGPALQWEGGTIYRVDGGDGPVRGDYDSNLPLGFDALDWPEPSYTPVRDLDLDGLTIGQAVAKILSARRGNAAHA